MKFKVNSAMIYSPKTKKVHKSFQGFESLEFIIFNYEF